MFGLNFLNFLEESMTSNNNYSIDDLKKWDDKICKIAKDFGLDWYPINYEISYGVIASFPSCHLLLYVSKLRL